MALVFIKKGKFGGFKFFDQSLSMFDGEMNIADFRMALSSPPDLNELMMLTRPPLEALVKTLDIGDPSKMNKREMITTIQSSWELITKHYAIKYGCVSVFGLLTDAEIVKPKSLNEETALDYLVCYISIQGKVHFEFFFNHHTKFNVLFGALLVEGITVSSPSGSSDWLIGCGFSYAYEHEFIINWGSDGATFNLHPRQRGGVIGNPFQKKVYVKKEDRLNALITRTKRFIQNRIEDEHDLIDDGWVDGILSFVRPIEEKMAEFRAKLLSSEISMRDVLETLDDTSMKNLTDLFKSSAGKNTEERIYKAAPLISRDIQLIDRTIPRLMNLRHHLMLLVAEAFVREFNDPKGTELVCKPEKMTEYLLNLASYRRGIQSRSEQVPVAEQSSNCRMG